MIVFYGPVYWIFYNINLGWKIENHVPILTVLTDSLGIAYISVEL